MATRRPQSETAAPRRRAPKTPPVPQAATQQAIAARAYALSLARGATHGADTSDWLTAERELSGAPPGEATP